MKKIMNRALSLILTAAMILSLSQNAFPGNGTVFMPGVYAAQNTTSGQAGALLKTSDSAQKAAVSDETSIDVIEEDIDQDTVEEQAALEAAEDILEDEIPESKSVKKEEQDSRTDKSGKKGQSDISDRTKKAGKADASQEADRSEKTGGSNKNGKAGKSAGSGKSDESGSSSSKSSSKSNASSSKNEEYDGDVVLETEDSHGKDEEDFSDDGEIIDSEEESSDSGKESAEAGLKNSGAGDTEQKAESGDEDSEDKEKSAGSGDEGSEEKEQSAGSGDEDSEEKEQSAGSGDEDSEEKEQKAESGDEDSEEKEQKAGSGAGNSEDTGDSGDGKESADSKEGAENSGGSGEGASEGGKSSEDKKETEGAEIAEDDDEKDAGSGSGTAEDNDGGDDHSGKTEHSDSTEKGNTEKKDTENTDKKGTEGSKKEEIEEDSGSESTAPADRDGGKASQNPAEGDTSAITEDSTGVTAGDEAAASAKEADVELRSITAEVVEIDPYARGGENGGINENNEGNAETFARAESFWQALFDRAPVPSADREGYEKLDKKDLTVQISGMLPEGVTAVVYAVPFTEDATWSETALMALDVVLYDRDGNLYVPKTGLELIFGGNIIKKTVKAQMPVLIYNFEENEKRAEKKKTYAADAAVYRDGTSYDDRLRYRTDGKKDSGKAKWTKGGLVFAEDENGLVTYTDNTLGITATAAAAVLAGSGSEAAGWNGPLHLIVSTQENDRTLSAKDGDTKVTVRGALSKTTKASLSLDSSSDAASDSRSGKSGSEELFAVDITLSDKEAGQYEPDLPVTVTISDPAIREALQAGSKIEVYRVAGDGGSRAADSVRETSDTIDEIAADEESGTETVAESARNSGDSTPGLEKIEITDIDGSSVQFEAQGPLSYVIKIITASKKLTASDGSEYLVTVSYDTASGIPENAQLDVREIKEGEEGYDDYVARSAEALGTASENLAFARAFDIKLTDPETGEKYQPAKDVKVSIQLLNQEIGKDDEISVIHFEEKEGQSKKANKDTTSPRVMASSVKGEAVEFETDGFSVYVVTAETFLCTYYFYTYNEYGDYAPYFFYTDQGTMTSEQRIKNGEKLFAPNNPSHPIDSKATFIGWYEGSTDEEGHITLGERFNFDVEQNITDPDQKTIYLYAEFSTNAFIRFHGQYDTAADYFPVVQTYMVDLSDVSSTDVDLSNFSAPYINPNPQDNNAFPDFRFSGWSETPFQTPGEGENFKIDHKTVTESVDLYPLYERVRWLSFVSGYTGTGATYFPPLSCAASNGISGSEMSSKIPERPGYTFKGWFLDVENAGTGGQNGTGLQLTDEQSVFLDDFNNVAASQYHVKLETDGEGNKTLWLTEAVNIYARWEATEVDYKIVVWTKMASEEECYKYEESFPLKGTNNTAVSVTDDYKNLDKRNNYNNVHDAEHQIPEGGASPYEGFSFNETKSDTAEKTITYDGTTVFNLYYDRTAAAGDGEYSLRFVYPQGTSEEVVMKYQSGASLGDVVMPAAPETREGYDFFWYADQSCTARVFFDQSSFNSYKDGPKVLYTSMPGQDLTVYGGWTEKWYLVQIDPNYGEMRNDDTNSTYFWKTYNSDYIQEYTWITRNYVESETGDYYYVNHNYTNPGMPRRTYYTKNVSEATELKTFKEAPGTYVDAGWYEVKEDGTEERYIFGEPINRNITLKLHWKMAGNYYLEYNAAVTVDGVHYAGTLTGGVSALQDENPYLDQASIDLTLKAEPPEGYEFIGWRVRGDDNGKIFYPGETFTLPAEYALTVNGKKKVYLDAVYGQAGTAKIVYDANGGAVTESADGGYPYKELEENGTPKALTTHKVTRDTGKGTVVVSGIVNNTPIRLSSGAGFTAPENSGAVLSGWNTKQDGSGTHYELDAWKDETDKPYYVDTAEPITLYAEWKVRAYFDKNEGTDFDSNWGGYTLVDDSLDEHNGQYYTEVFINSTLSEPPGKVVKVDLSFDFWSTKKAGGQEDAFDFSRTKISGGLTLYAQMTNAVKVPFHVTEETEDKDTWRKMSQFRLAPAVDDTNPTFLYLDPSDTSFVESALSPYVAAPEGYKLSYACLSDSPEHVSDSDESKVVAAVYRTTTTDIHIRFKNGQESLLAELPSGQEIYLVYAPESPLDQVNVKVVYVKETAGGELVKLKGSADGSTETEYLTYNREKVAIANVPEQGQDISVNKELTQISQDSTNVWHMLPLLDDGTDALSQVYFKIGVGNGYSDNMNISDLGGNISADLKLCLQIRDNKLCWSFDGGDEKNWTEFTAEYPTIYAVYRERGYELEITKTVGGEDTGIDPEKTFVVTLSSMAITRESYSVEGTGYPTVDAVPASGSQPGTIVLNMKDGTDVKIFGVAKGTYTISETRNEGFTVSAKLNGTETSIADPFNLNANTSFDITNTPVYICRIDNMDAGEIRSFYTLNRALAYAGEEMDGTATIEMLIDYVMPSTDALEIPSGYHITLTGRGTPKTITRDLDFTGGSMFTNYGTLKFDDSKEEIVIDGNGTSVLANSAVISNQGTLVIGKGAAIQNAACSGNGSAVFMTGGSLTVEEGAALAGNTAVNGGAVYTEGGSVTVSGGNINSNSAGNGGAICYTGSGSVSISGGSFTENRAQNGGVIYASGGTMIISGGIFGGSGVGNSASDNGGVIYLTKAIAELSELSGNTLQLINNSAQNGGAVYVKEGTLTVFGGSMSQNSATGGNGGAIYNKDGAVGMSDGNMTQNSASSGYGGAVYTDTGSFAMSGGIIGGSTTNANSAKNGAGVYVNSGTAGFTGTAAVTYNKVMKTGAELSDIASGGAIGVGSNTARLNFSGSAIVQNNKGEINQKNNGGSLTETIVSTESNIYLDHDSSDIINVDTLTKNAYLGVYVPEAFGSTLFKNRGTVTAHYATYTSSDNVKDCVRNDRLDEVRTGADTSSNNLYWYKDFKVEARSLNDKVLPTGGNGSLIGEVKWYNPPSSTNGASEIAADFLVSKSVSVGTRAFAGAYIYGASSFAEYITEINWDDAKQKWVALKRDGTAVDYKYDANKSWLILYYANPAYLSIENNDDAHTLTISSLEWNIDSAWRNTLNSTTQAGYGYVVAVNGATLDALRPITVDAAVNDFELGPGDSIKFLFPGAVNAPFRMTGAFTPVDTSVGSISCTLVGYGNQTNTCTINSSGAVNAEGRTKGTAGATYEMLFGGSKIICKIVTDSELSGPVAGTDYVRKETRDDNKVEYFFGTLTKAVVFAENYQKTSSIEMLTDYLIPLTDNVTIPEDCQITFTTAVDKGRQYPGTDPDRRATLSRDAGNTASLITAIVAKNKKSSLTIDQINFDGKNLGGNNEFGAIKTKNCNVSIKDANFVDFKAMQGGAVSVDFDGDYTYYVNNSLAVMGQPTQEEFYGLSMENAHFERCASKLDARVGGGAIWTCARDVSLKNCTFEKCTAVDQGGAIFQRIEATKIGGKEVTTGGVKVDTRKDIFNKQFTKDSNFYMENCQFVNCEAKAGGAAETEAFFVEIDGCVFRNCSTNSRNAGAINVYYYERDGNFENFDSSVIPGAITRAYFKSCMFENCYAKTKGGGIRSLADYLYVYDCTFANCIAEYQGGAICVYSDKAKEVDIQGTTMYGCISRINEGGGIYCNAPVLEIGDYTYSQSDLDVEWFSKTHENLYSDYIQNGGSITGRKTNIKHCTSKNAGGGIAFMRNDSGSSVTINGAVISNNESTSTGGGLYTKSRTTELTGCAFHSNTASGNGGGICDDANNQQYNLLLYNCTVEDNKSGGMGGGIYTLTQLTLADNTQVTGNRLTSNTKDNAAGVYLSNNRTLTVGKTLSDGETLSDGTISDGTSVMNNVTVSNAHSNMRLWWDNVKNHKNSVKVLCNLSGKIYVVNAARKGDQFGLSLGSYIGFKDSGFKELEHTFIADDGPLFGVFDRTDSNESDGINIIWRGDIVCKLTDANGRILYLDEAGQEPAIFDRLDYDKAGSPVSAFSYLRQNSPNLWVYNEQQESYDSFNVSNNTCCVKLLMESYDLQKEITTGTYTNRTIILTTAGRTDSMYPYTGRAGTRASIHRGSVTGSLITAGVKLTLRNIVLDGDKFEKNGDGGLISSNQNNSAIKLAENAMLQNSSSSGRGGAVFVDKGCVLSIEGGTIYNCSAQNGGGVYIAGGSGTHGFSSGLITKCNADENGGGVYLGGGTSFDMSGGSQITRCSAANGGGVFVNAGKTMNMTGGSITLSTATEKGGGIATGENAKLYFSGRVTVNGNKLGTSNCNVELDYNKNTIIQSKGLERGSYVGVYVSGNYVPLTEEQRKAGIKHSTEDGDPYLSHGGEDDPFGTWQGDTRFLYFFVNDRNDLKGGLKTGTTAEDHYIYWTTIFSLKVSKLVMSDDSRDQIDSFKFVVELEGNAEADGQSASTINEVSEEWADGTTVSFENGRAEFYLKTGQERIWNYLPAGIKYTVTEEMTSAQKAHYTTFPVEKDGSGNPVKIGTINENLYKADAVSKYRSDADFRNMTAVCKITLLTDDSNDGCLLYEYDDDSGARRPAVYSRLATAFDYVNSQTPLYYKDAYTGKWTAFHYGTGKCNIEMLVPDYSMTEALTLQSGRKVCLTTADREAEDGYPYAGSSDDPSVIRRGGFTNSSMFTAAGTLTLKNINLDGNRDDYSCSVNGGIATVIDGGELAVTDGAMLHNSATSAKGGAVYVKNGGVLSMTGGTISGNASVQGGAVDIEGSEASMRFSGSPRIYDNLDSEDKQKNVVLSVDNNGVILVTGTLTLTDDTIKVGVYDATATEKHRAAGDLFGSYTDSYTTNLSVFVNDLDPDLYGVADTDKESERRVCWVYSTISLKKDWILLNGYDSHPDNVTLRIKNGTNVVQDNIILNSSGSWEAISKRLKPGMTYVVEETKVGNTVLEKSVYSAAYSENTLDEISAGNIAVTVTNTNTLIPVLIKKIWDSGIPSEQREAIESIGFKVYGIVNGTEYSIDSYIGNWPESPELNALTGDSKDDEWKSLVYVPKFNSAGKAFTSYKIVEENVNGTENTGVWVWTSYYEPNNEENIENWHRDDDGENYRDVFVQFHARNTDLNQTNTRRYQNVHRMDFYFMDIANGKLYYSSTDFGGAHNLNRKSLAEEQGEGNEFFFVKVRIPRNVDVSKIALLTRPNDSGIHLHSDVTDCDYAYGILTYNITGNDDRPTGGPNFSQRNVNTSVKFDEIEFDVTPKSGCKQIEGTKKELRVYTPKVLSLTNRYSPIARVRNRANENAGWSEWKYFGVLVSVKDDNDEVRIKGAFDYANTLSGDVEIETLMETDDRYQMDEGFTFTSGRNVTLKTTQSSEWNPSGDGHFTTTIMRGAGNTSGLFTNTSGNFTLSDIILDGGNELTTPLSSTANGGLVSVANGGTLNVTEGAVLQNSTTSGNGGAVYVAAGGAMTMDAGTITGNSCTGSGNGAGIYLAYDASASEEDKKYGRLELSGSPAFGGTRVSNGKVSETTGNIKQPSNPSGSKNGNAEYNYPQQDIFLAGLGIVVGEDRCLPALVLKDNLSKTVQDGSIWVDAGERDHYYMLEQFAVLADDFPETVSEATYKAFRNARADSETDSGGVYLTGQAGPDLGDQRCVYWTGGFDVAFKKIDGYGNPLGGARFTLYKTFSYNDSDKTVSLIERTEYEGTSAAADDSGTGVQKGTVTLQKVPTGIYYMKESNAGTDADPFPTSVNGGKTFAFKNENAYVVLVGEANLRDPDEGGAARTGLWAADTPSGAVLADITFNDIKEQRGEDQRGEDQNTHTFEREYAIFLIDKETGKAVANPDVASFGILNEAALSREVILKKVSETYAPLENARFRIFRADLSEYTEGQPTDADGSKKGYYESGSAGVYFTGKLPLGKYYLVETQVPDPLVVKKEDGTEETTSFTDNLGRVFILQVDWNGMAAPAATGSVIEVEQDGKDVVTENLKKKLKEEV